MWQDVATTTGPELGPAALRAVVGRGGRRPRAVLALLLALAGGWLSAGGQTEDPLFESFTRRDGTKYLGIFVRDQGNAVVVALPEGAVVKDRPDAQRGARTADEVAQLSQSLNSLEAWIQKGLLIQAREEQPRLESAVAAFDKLVEMKLQSSASSDEFKASIRHARQYYRQQVAGVEPTIQAVELTQKLKALDQEIAGGRRPPSRELLLQIAAALDAVMRLDHLMVPVARERARVVADLERRVGTATDALAAAAIAQFRLDGRPDGARALLETLRDGAQLQPSFAAGQAKLVTGLTQAAAALAATLPGLALATFRFDGELREDADNYRKALRLLHEQNAGLAEAAQSVFGAPAAELAAALAARLAQNEQLIATAEAGRADIGAIREEYGAAGAAMLGGEYGKAVERYTALDAHVAKTALSATAFRQLLARLLLKAQALDLLQRLRATSVTPPDELKTLADEAGKFVTKNRNSLEGLGVRAPDYEIKIAEIEGYLQFCRRLEQLAKDFAKDGKLTWIRLLDLSAEVAKPAGAILPRARDDWAAYLRDREEEAFTRAHQDMAADKFDWADPRDQRAFLGLLDFLLRQNESTATTVLAEEALDKLRRPATDAFVQQLLDAELKAAHQLAGRDNDAALAAYTAIGKRFPAFAAERQVDALVVDLLKTQASRLGDAELETKIARLERICREYPAHADAKLFDQLFAAKRRHQPELAADPQAWLPVLEAYARDFPGRLRETATLAQVQTEQLAAFAGQWDADGHNLAAAQAFAALAAAFPHVVEDAELADRVIALSRKRLNNLYQQVAAPAPETAPAPDAENQPPAGRKIIIPERLIAGLEQLLQPAFAAQVRRYKLDEMVVVFRLYQADSYLKLDQVGSVAKAFAVFAAVQQEFPDLARVYRVADRQQAWRWHHRLERVRLPLGLYGRWDWLALGTWVLFWLAYFLRAVRAGRRHGYLRYSLWHFLTVLALFLGLLAFLLLGSHGILRHAPAAGLALLIPGVVCHGLGFFSYAFFPLVYTRRRLVLGKAALRLADLVPGLRARLGGLRTSVRQLEEDAPLLHDPWLFRMAQAIRLADRDVPAAYAAFRNLLAKLDHELIKDEAWREHHKTCLFNLGQLAWKLNHFAEAQACLTGHLELDPRSLDTHELLADLQFSRQLYEQAIPHFKVCLAADSRNAQRWFQLGRCFFAIGKYPAACKCFEAMPEHDRDSLLCGARAYARAGLHQKSVEWYERLLRDNPTDGEALFYLASSFAQLNEDVKALKIVTLVPPDSPHYPPALALQGSVCLRNRKPDKAAEFYRSALEYDADLGAALLGLAQLELAAGRLDDAAAYLERLLQREPDHPAANYCYGIVLETRDPELALAHFGRALAAPQFKRLASNHLGRLHFFRGDHAGAIQYFEIGATAGELSPWFLYLYAYALAEARELGRCQQVLIQILGHTTPDADWQAHSARAMYSIGHRLFAQADYRMAAQCFEYVREHLDDPSLRGPLEALLEEARFRQVVGLLGRGDYPAANSLVSELQLGATDPERAITCQYYLALCQLYLGDLAPARDLLATLVAQARAAGRHHDYPRYLYHLAAAEIELGNAAAATTLLDELAAAAAVPPHVAMGVHTLQAYLLARAGQVREAEQRLAEVPPPAADYPGATFVRQRFLLIRAYYLCRIQDAARLQFLVRDMDEATQAQAGYLQALSCLEGGQVAAARHNLQPFADRSDGNRELFALLSAELAARALAEAQDARATEILAQVPAPPPEIATALQTLQTAGSLAALDDLPRVRAASERLSQQLAATTDPVLQHDLIHNQAILILRQALLVEETREKEGVEECWQNFWAFWEPYVFHNKEYWSKSLERLSAPGAAIRPFTDKENAGLNLAFREDTLARLFLGHIIAYLCQPGGQTDLSRHLNYLTSLGTADQKLNDYLLTLGEQTKDFVDRLDKGDPILKTWDFVIGYLRIQLTVAAAAHPDEVAPLQAQLETYLEFRNHYAAPGDFLQAKRVFNTALLETLQMGINGKFSGAGERLEAVLGDLPHGVTLGDVEEGLWKLREACRRPSVALDRGVNLVQEYERAYQRVVKFTLQKGS